MAVTVAPHVRGRFRIEVFNPDGEMVDFREANNIMCVAGYSVLAAAVGWSCALDQNSNLGVLLSPTYCAPVYGAVGSGTNITVTSADTALATELGRSVVYSSTSSSTPPGPPYANTTLGFFLGTSGSNWTISEAGVFLQATSTAGSGSLLNHAVISPSVSKLSSQTATLSVQFQFS